MGARSRTGKSSKAAATKSKESVPKHEVKNKAETASKSLLQKAVDKDTELTPEEALQAAHWIRQALGVIVGLIFGIVPFTGAPAILSYFVLVSFGAPVILNVANDLDLEEIAQFGSIQTEGLMPSFALFLLTWILSYTVFLPPRS